MSTTSPLPVPRGEQRPRLDVRPRGTPGHRETVKLCNGTGLHLDPWQEYLLAAWLTERGDRYAALECAGIVGRQNGKGAVLEAVGLDSLFVSKLPLTIWTAHLFKTAHEAFMRLQELIQRDPVLDAKVENYYRSAARLAVVLKNGNRVEFLARSLGAGRGLSAPRVILDEAMYLTMVTMGALFPTMAAQRDPQLIYTGSAGFDHSEVLHRLRRRALAGGDDRLAYLEWSVDPDSYDMDSPAVWALANPALGIRISEDFIRAERNALSEDEFRRERLGIFDPEPSDVGDLAIGQEAWRASFDGLSRVPGEVTFGLDVGPEDRALASLAFAGHRADGLLHVEVVHRAEPGDWIVEQAVRCTADGSPLVLDPSGSASAFLPDLIAAGVPVVTVTQRELASACVRFALMVGNGQVRHLGSGDLNAAVATAVRSPRGDAFKWKRRIVSAPDLSPLYAVTLAAWPQEGDQTPAPAIY